MGIMDELVNDINNIQNSSGLTIESHNDHLESLNELVKTNEEEPQELDISESAQYNPSDPFDIIMNEAKELGVSDEELEAITKGVNDIVNSLAGMIKRCNPDKCNIKDQICPYVRIGRFPISKLCPIERSFAEAALNEYSALFGDEYGSAKSINKIDTLNIHKLVELDLQDFRIRAQLEDSLTIDNPAFAVKESGEIIYNKQEHPLINTSERIERMRNRVLTRSLTSRESKRRYDVVDNSSVNEDIYQIIESIENTLKDIKNSGKTQ